MGFVQPFMLVAVILLTFTL